MIPARYAKIRLPTVCDPREPSALVKIPVRDPRDPNYWGDVQREHDQYRAGFERSQLGRLLLIIAVAMVGCAIAVLV